MRYLFLIVTIGLLSSNAFANRFDKKEATVEVKGAILQKLENSKFGNCGRTQAIIYVVETGEEFAIAENFDLNEIKCLNQVNSSFNILDIGHPKSCDQFKILSESCDEGFRRINF
jgi:hypothetical protein